MLIFHEKKIAYIHVPKTAGTAMRKVLEKGVGGYERWWGRWSPGEKDVWWRKFEKLDFSHLTVSLLREMYPRKHEELLGMRKFSVARDPYDRACSAYGEFKKQFEKKKLAPNIKSMLDYLMAIKDGAHKNDRRSYLYVHGTPQVDFYYPDHMILYGADLSENLSDIFGVKLEFKMDAQKYGRMSSVERSLVEEIYHDDLEMFKRVKSNVH